MTNIINATLHPIFIYEKEGDILILKTVIPTTDLNIRLKYQTNFVRKLETEFGDLIQVETKYSLETPLPEEKEDTLYIVSRVVSDNIKRNDFLSLNGLIKKSGTTIGCRSLSKY